VSITEVIPGIYQLKLPMPMPDILLGYVNVYLVQGNNGYLIVDTGWNTDEAFDALEKQLAEIGIGITDISQIVVTHIHPDHYGLAGRLKQLSQAKFSFHHLDQDLIRLRYVNMDDLLEQTSRWLYLNGVPQDEVHNLQVASVGMVKYVAPTLPDVVLHGGETISTGIFSFKVLWTPGHSPGHVCLYEPTRKFLISGDHILPTITPNIGLHPQSSENPLGDYLNSLKSLKQLDAELVLPGHENPFTDLKLRIDKIIQHHGQRNANILAETKSEPKTAYQIAKGFTWMADMGGIGWQNLSPLDKRLAVLETLSHLESMRFDGKVDKFSRDSIIYYQKT